MSFHQPPRDELTLRYQEASADDTRRPAPRVREAVLAHARVLAAANPNQKAAGPHVPQLPAANQSRWKVPMLAGVMLAGLAGLLVLEIDHGTPEEKALVRGAPVPAAVQVPAPTSVPTPVPDAAPAPMAVPPQASAQPSAAAERAAQVQPGIQARKPAPPQPDMSGAASPMARSEEPNAPAAAPAAPAGMAAVPSLQENSADAVAQPAGSSAAPFTSASKAAQAQASPDVPARQTGRLAQTLHPSMQDRKATEAGAQRPAGALHDAARSGDQPELERLIAQGAALDALDSDGKTPLMLAVANQHADLVQRLVAAGANRALVDRDGFTALQQARRLGLERIAGMLSAP